MDSDLLNNDRTISLMLGEEPDLIAKAPDCVCQTIIRRMEELNNEISDCKELLNKLESEYTAHANFIMNGPFERRDLSHGSDNTIESPQPSG